MLSLGNILSRKSVFYELYFKVLEVDNSCCLVFPTIRKLFTDSSIYFSGLDFLNWRGVNKLCTCLRISQIRKMALLRKKRGKEGGGD